MIDIIVIDTQQHYKQYQVLLDIANVKIWAATVFCFLVPVSISPSSFKRSHFNYVILLVSYKNK